MGYKTYTCPAAKSCGACEWLNVPYPIQLKRKKEQLEELFKQFDVPVDNVIGMEEPQRYRAKIMAPFVRGAHARPSFGMYAKGTHRIVEAKSCLVEYPEGREILASVADLAKRFRIHPYDEDRGTGLLRHAVVRVAHSTGEVMLTLVINRKEFPHKREFVRELRDRHPEIATVVFNVNTRKTNAVLGPLFMTAFGQGWLEDELCGCAFRIPAAAFYQTNPVATETLYNQAIQLASLKKGDRVLDAYCGIGIIGIVAASQQRIELVGVEEVADAAHIAAENARINRIRDARFLADDAGAFLEQAAAAGEHFDVVFMDPPRAGASEQFCDALIRTTPERVVYISCNPATQARDLALLERAYRIERIVPVDMFPHTKHVETVALLTRIV